MIHRELLERLGWQEETIKAFEDLAEQLEYPIPTFPSPLSVPTTQAMSTSGNSIVLRHGQSTGTNFVDLGTGQN